MKFTHIREFYRREKVNKRIIRMSFKLMKQRDINSSRIRKLRSRAKVSIQSLNIIETRKKKQKNYSNKFKPK